jgi:hypothetical protein
LLQLLLSHPEALAADTFAPSKSLASSSQPRCGSNALPRTLTSASFGALPDDYRASVGSNRQARACSGAERLKPTPAAQLVLIGLFATAHEREPEREGHG